MLVYHVYNTLQDEVGCAFLLKRNEINEKDLSMLWFEQNLTMTVKSRLSKKFFYLSIVVISHSENNLNLNLV